MLKLYISNDGEGLMLIIDDYVEVYSLDDTGIVPVYNTNILEDNLTVGWKLIYTKK